MFTIPLQDHCLHIFSICQAAVPVTRGFATQKSSKSDTPENLDKPIEFLQSPAAQWKAQWSTEGIKDDRPWYEMYIVLFCTSVFLIYFCVLREENDIDKQLEQPLFNHVPGLEQQTLIITHKYNVQNGVSNRDIEKRMQELGMDVNAIRKQNMT